VKKSGFSVTSAFFLQLCLGVFFLTLAIMGFQHYDSAAGQIGRFFGQDQTMSVITAVLELVVGVILLIGLFLPIFAGGIGKICSIALFILWAVYMFIGYFLHGSFFKPSALVWFNGFARDSVLLVALWMVGRKYM